MEKININREMNLCRRSASVDSEETSSSSSEAGGTAAVASNGVLSDTGASALRLPLSNRLGDDDVESMRG